MEDKLKFDLRRFWQRVVIMGLILPFTIGFIWPEKFWGSHFTAFLPFPGNILFLLVPILLILWSHYFNGHLPVHSKFAVALPSQLPFFLAFAAGLVFLKFPIAADYYGNARSFIPLLDDTVEQLPSNLWRDFFIPNFKPGSGRQGVMLIYTYLTYLLNTSYQLIFTWSGAICGALFIGLWTQAILVRIKDPGWRVALILCGTTSPFLLIFMGHIETYAPLYLLLLCYGLCFSNLFKTKKFEWWLILLFLQLLGIRFHMLFTLLLPSFLVLTLIHFRKMKYIGDRLHDFKGLFTWIYLPLCLVGIVVYVIILKDYSDLRTLDHINDIERLFLPIFSPASPLDRYNLFSWNHSFDFINNILSWSPCFIYLLITAWQYVTPKVPTEKHDWQLLGLALLLVISFLFMFNPLLSMPMDWDLFVFPVPLLMVMLLLMVEHVQPTFMRTSHLFISVGFAIFCLPSFFVHSSPKPLSDRLEQVGIHVYKTYYLHSSTYLLYSLLINPESTEKYMARKGEILESLKRYALPGKDKHYALLLTDSGITALRSSKDFVAAKNFFKQALYYDPDAIENVRWLSETEMQSGNAAEALRYAELLVKGRFHNQVWALRQCLRCSLLINSKEKALGYCLQLSEIEPNAHDISQICSGLNEGKEPRSLLVYFD